MSEKTKYAAGILIGALFLWLFLRKVDFSALVNALRTANIGYIFLGILAHLVAFVSRAVRWKYLLLRIKRVRFQHLFSAVCIGFMAITLLPLRIGEFIRAYVLGRREQMNVSSVFATVAVERILDGLSILVFFAVFLLVLGFPADLSAEGSQVIERLKTNASYVGAPLMLGAVAVMILLILKPRLAPRLTRTVLFFLPEKWKTRMTEIVESFVEGFSIFTDPKSMLWVAVHSVILWLTVALSMWFCLLGFDIRLPLASIFAVMILVTVGVAIPTPGGIGGYHYLFQISLVNIFGVELNVATAAILVCHAVAFFPVTLLGLYFAGREELALSTMSSIAREERQQAKKDGGGGIEEDVA